MPSLFGDRKFSKIKANTHSNSRKITSESRRLNKMYFCAIVQYAIYILFIDASTQRAIYQISRGGTPEALYTTYVCREGGGGKNKQTVVVCYTTDSNSSRFYLSFYSVSAPFSHLLIHIDKWCNGYYSIVSIIYLLHFPILDCY